MNLDPQTAGVIIGLALCPDCDADQHLIEQAPGIYVLAVLHDDTCPTYRRVRS